MKGDRNVNNLYDIINVGSIDLLCLNSYNPSLPFNIFRIFYDR
jgi:hypothetical protein